MTVGLRDVGSARGRPAEIDTESLGAASRGTGHLCVDLDRSVHEFRERLWEDFPAGGTGVESRLGPFPQESVKSLQSGVGRTDMKMFPTIERRLVMTKWKLLAVRATPAITLATIVITAAAGKKWA
jgi:hypothetical protein